MPRIRIMFYAEMLIPWNLAKKVGEKKVKEIASKFHSILLRHKLLEKCLNKLKKMGLIGEWLRELWFYEISEEKSDVANGTTREKEGLNIWYFQWVYTAAPLEVIAMEDKIQKETMTKERVKIDNIDAIIESYITVAEED